MSDSGAALPRAIYSSEQVRSFDLRATDELGIGSFELMRRAAQSALDYLRTRWPSARSLLIHCGSGNNGGDGYVLAALAAGAGLDARIVAAGDPVALREAAAEAYALARKARVAVEPFRQDPYPGFAPDVVVDALIGTGLTRRIKGTAEAAVNAINASGRAVLALDVPTGLDSDTGEIRGAAVAASATICFVGLKSGLFLGAGPGMRGDLAFSSLEVPRSLFDGAPPVLWRPAASKLREILRPRSRLSHKGLNGRVLVIGGAPGMAGAARLAAEAALRAGAGLVHAAVAPESVVAVMAGRPEILCRGIDGPEAVADLIGIADVIAVGPGLGRGSWGERLAEAAFSAACPLVVDADALHFLAQRPRRREGWVLTPHPGEAGQLLGMPAGEVQKARASAVRELARRHGGIAVLKGACSLIAEADENSRSCPSVCDYGNPGMATAGMGDVLAGVLAALIGQLGFSRDCVEAGVIAHALAGDDAARDGERGLIASDLFPHLRRRVNPP